VPAGENSAERWVGRRLREARQQRDLTLAVVAEQVGVSVTHLSRLEKSERQPSIGVLLELARAYNIGVGELLGEEPTSGYHLVRAGSARSGESAHGPYTTISGLGPGAALRAVRLELPPGTHNRSAVQHLGEEWIYVIAGQVGVDFGGELLNLTTGDALHFDAQTSHQLSNPGSTIAELLVVSTPATTQRR
jgi:transcriptional regulator with XRE-family HTH domain